MEQAEVFEFVRERDEAILSLDEKKIKRFCKKYGGIHTGEQARFLGRCTQNYHNAAQSHTGTETVL